MGRAPCCDKANVKKGPWSPEEDSKLKEYIEKYGTGGNWIALPQKAGLKRCGKSCRLRWLNYLRPNIKHGEFSEEEDRIICSLFANIGSRWSIIAAQLPGRTDNDIKNYWNTKLKKKLMGFVNPGTTGPNNSQRKIQSLPFTNNIISSHETTPPTNTTTSSSFSLSQPLLMSSSLAHKDHKQYYSNYSSSYYTTSTPITSNRSPVFSLSGLENQVANSTSTSSSNSAFSTNLYSSIFQTQDYCYNLQCCNNYPLKEINNNNINLIMFGSTEGSCSTSSEGSCNYQIKQEEMGHSFYHQNQAYDMGNVATFDSHDHQDHISQRFLHNHYGGGSNNNIGDHNVHDCNFHNFWGQKSSGHFGDMALDIDHHQQYQVLLQDVKQLIIGGTTSSSQGNNIINGSNNFFNI